jgi:hypothetical protein
MTLDELARMVCERERLDRVWDEHRRIAQAVIDSVTERDVDDFMARHRYAENQLTRAQARERLIYAAAQRYLFRKQHPFDPKPRYRLNADGTVGNRRNGA